MHCKNERVDWLQYVDDFTKRFEFADEKFLGRWHALLGGWTSKGSQHTQRVGADGNRKASQEPKQTELSEKKIADSEKTLSQDNKEKKRGRPRSTNAIKASQAKN